MKKIAIAVFLVVLLSTSNAYAINWQSTSTLGKQNTNIIIDVGVLRFLEETETYERFDAFVRLTAGESVFTSEIFESVRAVDVNLTCTIPVSLDHVTVVFEAFVLDEQHTEVMLDLDADNGIGAAVVEFDVRTGLWSGEDFLGDMSGVGRLNGCDDGSLNRCEGDVELFFDIYVDECDGDGVPDWAEQELLGTNPCFDDSLRDDDGDGVPLWWEYRFGFDPFVFEDHSILDLDDDGLNNVEEFMTAQWGSDPYRDDIFLELDQMQKGPDGEGYFMPEQSKEMLVEPFHRRNIVYHIDDGCMGGGELIPFEQISWMSNDKSLYADYFLHGDEQNWRRGVFHWGLVTYDHRPRLLKGYAFQGESVLSGSVREGRNCFIVSSKSLMQKAGPGWPPCSFELAFASAVMHEFGHGLGILGSDVPGCDNQKSRTIFGIGFWLYGNYKSCMNYRYCYRMLDYSDGSHGWGDFDDWNFIELGCFQEPFN